MRNLLLSAALVAIPVGVFVVAYDYLASDASVAQAATASASLGDMSSFTAIITEVQDIVAKGDFPGAEKRITDFETAWDDAEATLRPVNAAAWGNVDSAADSALKALRSSKLEPAKVAATLIALQSALANPDGATGAATAVSLVSGIAVTDTSGHALPCEAMLKDLSALLQTAKLAAVQQGQVTDLQAKALERCNADDDARADGFSAEAIALLSTSN